MSSQKSFLRVVESSEDFHQGVWRRNSNLVIAKNAVFPDRCILCNQPAHGLYMKKVFVWHSPLLLPIIVLSFPIYLFLALWWRKILRVDIPLCPKHRNKMLAQSFLAVLMLPQFVILGIVGLQQDLPALILGGLVSSILGALLLLWARHPVWAWFLQTDYGLIKGAHPDFIKALPEWDRESL